VPANFVDPLGIVHIDSAPGSGINIALCEAEERRDKWGTSQLQPSHDALTCLECVSFMRIVRTP
jgi:hypothetical protein